MTSSRLRSLIENARAGRALVVAVLLAGAAARVWLAIVDDGIYWPDEIYQSLEPAHRLVFGYGLISWEYGLGARGWTFPGLVSGVMYLASAVGLNDPRGYLTVIRILMSAAGVATAGASYLLARRWGARPSFAACGAAFFAITAPAIYFGPKALSEPASALPLVLGLALALPPGAGRADRAIGTSLVGFATLIRFHIAIFGIAMVAVWIGRRQWRELGECCGVFAIWAVLFGLIDRVTFGEWFLSVILYMKFTIGGGGPVTGSSPATYYPQMLLGSMPLAFAAAAILAIVGTARARGLAFVVAVVLVAHSMTPNKAYRYVLPALPLIGALAAIGLDVLWSRKRSAIASASAALLLGGCVWSLVTMKTLTFGDIGPYETTRPGESAYDDKGPVNRLLIVAGRQPDLCGLRVNTDPLVWIGGYSYFHNPAPLFAPDGPARSAGVFNYAIVHISEIVGNPVAFDGEFALRKVSSDACRPVPDYDWRLPGFEQIKGQLGR